MAAGGTATIASNIDVEPLLLRETLPRCHLPMLAVAYPASFSVSAIVISALGRNFLYSGIDQFLPGDLP